MNKRFDPEIRQAIHSCRNDYLQGDPETWISYLPEDYRNTGTTNKDIWKSRPEIYDFSLRMFDQFAGQFEFRNAKNEELGYERVLLSLKTAGSEPQEIIDNFHEPGALWTGGRMTDDDITFVVIKVQ